MVADSAQFKAMALCVLEVFECIRNRDRRAEMGDLCQITGYIFASLLGDKCKQWYFHVLCVHIPQTLATIDVWSLSASTGEARQRAQRLIRLRRVWNGIGDKKSLQLFLAENQAFAACQEFGSLVKSNTKPAAARIPAMSLGADIFDVMKSVCEIPYADLIQRLQAIVVDMVGEEGEGGPAAKKHFY